MSAINGLEVYKVLRKIKPNIKIIKMAIYRQGIEDFLDQHKYVDAYNSIYTPYNIEKFLQLLEQVMLGKTKELIQERKCYYAKKCGNPVSR